jgi:hypothetical protein
MYLNITQLIVLKIACIEKLLWLKNRLNGKTLYIEKLFGLKTGLDENFI